jgi:hypothetical protein
MDIQAPASREKSRGTTGDATHPVKCRVRVALRVKCLAQGPVKLSRVNTTEISVHVFIVKAVNTSSIPPVSQEMS